MRSTNGETPFDLQRDKESIKDLGRKDIAMIVKPCGLSKEDIRNGKKSKEQKRRGEKQEWDIPANDFLVVFFDTEDVK